MPSSLSPGKCQKPLFRLESPAMQIEATAGRLPLALRNGPPPEVSRLTWKHLEKRRCQFWVQRKAPT